MEALAKGSHGADVLAVQKMLNASGGSGTKLAEDSTFGPLTEAAVKTFQSAHSLQADGIVGPLTMAALQKATAGGQPPPKP